MRHWVSMHAFHHGGGQDRLITEAVVPELTALQTAGSVEDWFFLRYWDGGPHVRVRARPAPGRAEVVRDGLRTALTGHVAAHPSTAPMSPAVYAEIAELMARQEQRTDFCREPYEPDAIVEIEYVPETHAYGTGPALDAVERHFGTSSRLAAQVLATGATPGRKRGLVLSMTVLTLAVLRPDPSRLTGAPLPGSPKPAGDHPAEELDRIRDHVARLWTATRSDDGADAEPGGLLSGWLGAVRELHGVLTRLAADGRFDVPPPPSPLFWCLPDASAADAVLARCTHLIANRIGVPIVDEISLNMLIARAVATRVPGAAEGIRS